MSEKRSRATREELAVRRNRALELRLGHTSYRTIAKELGVHLSQSWKDVDAALSEHLDKRGEISEKVLNLELLRLDKLQVALFAKLKNADPDTTCKIARTAVRLMERRARYLGLDAPTKIQNEVEITELQSIIREIAAEKEAAERVR